MGDYLFNDTDFISRLSTETPDIFQKIFDEIKYLCKVATAGSKEGKELARIEKMFADVYRETGAKKPAAEGGVKYSLLVKDSRGNATAVDPHETTKKQTHDYMIMARKGQLDQNTYFPVSPHTAQTIISTLSNAGIDIDDKPLAMQAKKARQSQNEGKHIERDGTVIRHHALSPNEIQEVIDKLDDPFAAIYQQDRVTAKTEDGKKVYLPAPDNFVFFVTLDSGKECVAVIEFDSTIDKRFIQEDGRGDEYHTTVTVFEPDQYRDGEPFDYLEYLAVQQSNRELEIKKESSKTETASRQTQATVSEEELSNNTVTQVSADVKGQMSLSSNEDIAPVARAGEVYGSDIGIEAPVREDLDTGIVPDSDTEAFDALMDEIQIRDTRQKLDAIREHSQQELADNQKLRQKYQKFTIIPQFYIDNPV